MKNFFIAALLLAFSVSLQAQIDRSAMPKPGPPPEVNLGSPQTFQLNSGLKVMVVEDHKLPRVSAYLILDNPPVLEGDKAGVSSLTASLLGNGSVNIPKDDFYDEVDFLGASIQFGAQNATARSLSKYFPRILELMADAAINPNFTEEDFETEKARLLTSLKNQDKDVRTIAERVQAALAYGKGHPYGEFTTEESVNNISLADVEKFYREYFVPAKAYLVVIGDTTLEDVQDMVARYFTSWTKAAPPTISFTPPSNVQYTQLNFVDMPNAVQSEIRAENLVDLRMNDPDYLPALLANRIIGGGALGRLNQNIREDKGYAYYAYSSLGNDKYQPATFEALTSVRNTVTDSAVVQILQEMDSINLPTITEEELRNVKAEYTGSFVMALEKPETIARYALNIETENLPSDFYTTYLERLNAIGVDEVQKAADKFIKSAQMRIVIAGKGSEILQGLEAITYRGKKLPVFYFDKQANPVKRPEYDKDIPEGIDANTVLNTYLKAIGFEKNKIESLKLVYKGATMGSEIKMVEVRTEAQFAQTTYMNGSPMVGVVGSSDEFYMKQGASKVPLPPAMQNDLRKAMGVFPEEAILNNPAAKLTGIEKVDGKDTYRIDVPGEVMQLSYYYDVESGLKLKESSVISMNGQSQNQEVLYSDYKEVEGLMIPGNRKGSLGPQQLETILAEAQINSGISQSDFE